jgi:hypothetical protein
MGPGVVVHEVDAIDGEATVLIEWRHPLQARVPSADPLTSVHRRPDWLAVSGETDLDGLIKATEQARFLASLLREGDIPLPVVAFDAIDRLGIHWLIFHLRNDPMLSRFTDGLLSRLREEDRRGVLRETLRTYLATGGAGVETANLLGIHRNTLAYRLRRISALTGQDPADSGSWLAYGFALAAERVLLVEHWQGDSAPISGENRRGG